MQGHSGRVSLPGFDEDRHVSTEPNVREAIQHATARGPLDSHLDDDAERRPRIRRETLELEGSVDRILVSDSGFLLVMGWLADEGSDPLTYRLLGNDLAFEISPDCIYRYTRTDIDERQDRPMFDYGFVAFSECRSASLLKQELTLQIKAPRAAFEEIVTPELVSDKRFLDHLLSIIATTKSYTGFEVALHDFLSSQAGTTLTGLFGKHVSSVSSDFYMECFGRKPVSRTFVTVLFGGTDPLLFQPVLFREQKIDPGEWIYVCNSPEHAAAVTRIARLTSGLYGLMITVILLGDNIGFGAANNLAVANASSDSIYLLNPDVYPIGDHAIEFRRALEGGALDDKLWGGLLFYDDRNLMHGGMYFDSDTFVRAGSHAGRSGRGSSAAIRLIRVEHFDKGVPFFAEQWTRPRPVPAVTGATMAFDRRHFERLGGFSTRYIYGHYEDADLSIRWGNANGPVVVDPRIKLVHLEGQGSAARGELYRGAAIVNRHLFTLAHSDQIGR